MIVFNFRKFLLCGVQITYKGTWDKFQVHCPTPMDKPDNMLTRQTTSHALVQDGKQCHKFTQIFFFLDRELGAVHVSVISFGLVRLSATNVLAVTNDFN